MEFKIQKEKFEYLLYLSHSIVEKKNTMPILANVLLIAESNKLRFAATDLAVSLVGEVEAEVITPGSITLDANVLYDIVREMPNGQDITLQSGDSFKVNISAGNSRFRISGVSPHEFPSLAGVSMKTPVSIDAEMIYEMLEKTAFAVCTDESRYNMNGIQVEMLTKSDSTALSNFDKVIRFVATDGHRLAYIDRPAKGVELSTKVIIPRRAIGEIKKILEGNQGSAKLEISEGFLSIQSGMVTLGVRLVSGDFPEYRAIVPKGFTTEVKVKRDDIYPAVKRVALVIADKNKAFNFRINGNSLLVESSSQELGDANDVIEIEKKGDDLDIGFSARYLIDTLSALSESENVFLNMSGAVNPVVLKGDATEAFCCILMPMRFDA